MTDPQAQIQHWRNGFDRMRDELANMVLVYRLAKADPTGGSVLLDDFVEQIARHPDVKRALDRHEANDLISSLE